MDNLARNAFMAKQAGLSYGKWKAMQPIVTVAKKQVKTKVCPWCGKQFEASGKKEYCDNLCNRNAYYNRNKERISKLNKENRRKRKELANL